ncbi:MAG: glycosyltransferase [Cellvibrio sp.]|nr:glycosyltransferase [Cellvibrio sp.]
MTSKKKLLVCIPDFPFPARKNGISIRYFPIIEHLSADYDIHLLSIVNGSVSLELQHEALRFCSRLSIYMRCPLMVGVGRKIFSRLKSSVPGQIPFEFFRYDNSHIEHFIKGETKGVRYDAVIAVLVSYQALIKKLVIADRYILDVIDSPYSVCSRKLARGFMARYDLWLTGLWERKALKSADYAFYISPLDRLVGAGDCIDNSRVGVIPNGLFFDDHVHEKVPFRCRTVGYLGHMSYPPNIKAALRLYRIFNELYTEYDVQLVIIGRDPSAEILALASDPRVIVTGTVDNIWPYINGVDIFVFPMEIGSGQQNKLLEAMGAGSQ